ncbi:uncharacterized protein E0L32_002221 [Thyridium curvatum]|uniref:Malate dehydrogenase n=1 Tax=Thyridium curvatum TaxID=1093900 RepID=A0A507ACY2_9PEZI|nr:uncharacterized protein E0L32_002221 [Thyridium curvatum]TPX06725.1 hypothetical protein E0L32_002221 [Thyridium curvatum]
MLSKSFVVAGLLALASAGPCKPRPSNTGAPPPASTTGGPTDPTSPPIPGVPTLPSTGASDLPNPDPSLKLLHVALGHGIQNYTCGNETTSKPSLFGALAVLYDVTSFFPGQPKGLTQEGFNALTTTALWTTDIPLNLENGAAKGPGTPDAPNVLPEAQYGATKDPFPAPSDLTLGSVGPMPFLGHHFFDTAGVPTFDLSAPGLLGKVAKTGGVAAPATADKGILSTGAVDWLQLKNNGNSKGITLVYRVITAGGNPQACSVSGAPGAGSVPYTAFYWFYA